MHNNNRVRWSNVTFLVAFGVTLWFLYRVVVPFAIPLVLAVSAAIVLSPINEWLVRKLWGKRHLGATVSMLGTALLLLAPTAYISVRLAQEAIPLVQSLAATVGPGGFASLLEGQIPAPLQPLLEKFPVRGIESQIGAALESVANGLSKVVAAVPAIAANFISDAFLLLVVLYALFLRGPALARQAVATVPMKREYTERILKTISLGIRSIFVASFLTALIQGFVGFVGFFIAKVPYAIPLAALMAFFSFVFSLIPILGTGLVWVPAAIWLFFTGHPYAAVFLTAWGILVIGTVDNFVKPLFTQGPLQLPPSVVFVTLFGGIVAFGPVGALLGPLIAALSALFVRLWREDFLPQIGLGEPLPAEEQGGQLPPPSSPPPAGV